MFRGTVEKNEVVGLRAVKVLVLFATSAIQQIHSDSESIALTTLKMLGNFVRVFLLFLLRA